jgi:ATP-dependent Clp protease ATP-binding subunit ClpC
MRMNISVPDDLAKEVRERNLPISAICQRALAMEVGKLRAVEAAAGDPEGKELARLAHALGDPTLVRLVEAQNRQVAAVKRLEAAHAQLDASQLAELRTRIERLEGQR